MSDYKELTFPKHNFVLRFIPCKLALDLGEDYYYCAMTAYDIENFQKWINEEQENA